MVKETIHVPPYVPSSGRARVAFVGEAPSYEEVEKGEPFVGPSGRIFNAMLRTANLRREDYLITNVFDEQLPDNDVAHWTIPLAEARAQELTDLPPIGKIGFLKKEHRWHLDRLRDELLAASPDVIVPLGNTALWAFTGHVNISGYRGTILPATQVVPGAKLLPTYHPQFVMQSWKYFSVVTGDIEKAVQEAETNGSAIVLPKRTLWLEPNLADLKTFAPKLLTSDLMSVDIETGWGMITCIGFASNKEEAIVVPLVDLRQPNKSYWSTPEEELQAWHWIKSILESDVPKVGQNFAGYDFLWLLQKYGWKPRRMEHDTRLMHHVRYPELEKSLEFMGASYTSQGAWKQMGRKTMKRDD
jgi:uracil-DNA glycosylase